MPESAQISYFENYIEADAIKSSRGIRETNIDRNNQATNTNVAIAPQTRLSTFGTSMAAVNLREFVLFFNPTTVAFGKVEFKKTWVTAMYQETGDYLAL
jgi:hypothetical protein